MNAQCSLDQAKSILINKKKKKRMNVLPIINVHDPKITLKTHRKVCKIEGWKVRTFFIQNPLPVLTLQIKCTLDLRWCCLFKKKKKSNIKNDLINHHKSSIVIYFCNWKWQMNKIKKDWSKDDVFAPYPEVTRQTNDATQGKFRISWRSTFGEQRAAFVFISQTTKVLTNIF